MSTPPAPARVFAFVAAEADVCVLLRRGPSRQVLMVRWDLATDEFEIGQWVKARVYERRSDLSTDGKLFVYQALNPRWSTERGGAYSAVCHPPYFTALAFWNQGTNDPFFGWGQSWPLPKTPDPTTGTLPKRFATRLVEHRGAYAPAGWSRVGRGHPNVLVRDTTFGSLEWQCSLYEIRTEYRLAGKRFDVQWVDVDHRGRLLFAREGRIYVRDEDGERELTDLNPFEFRPLAPPDWATEWPT